MLNTDILKESSKKKSNDVSKVSIPSLDQMRNKDIQYNLIQDISSDHSRQSSGGKAQHIKSVQYVVNKMDKNSHFFNKIYHHGFNGYNGYNGFDRLEEEIGKIDLYKDKNQYKSATVTKDHFLIDDHQNIFQELNKESNEQNNKSTKGNFNQSGMDESGFDINKIPHSESVNLNNDYLYLNDATGTFNTYTNNNIQLCENTEKLLKNAKIKAESPQSLQKTRKK